jgi:hypothetical protein
MMISYPVLIYLPDADRDIQAWANVTHYYAGDPGKYYGPPENCYPAEDPEVDFFLSWKDNGPYSTVLNEYLGVDFDCIAQKILTHIGEQDEDS